MTASLFPITLILKDMENKKIRSIFQKVALKKLSPKEAYLLLKHLPYQDIGFAKVDHHRSIRKGFPEVVFCEGKTPEQVAGIMLELFKKSNSILATRASKKNFAVVKKVLPFSKYSKTAKIISVCKKRTKRLNKSFIAVITAGTSDIPSAEEACVTAEFLENKVERFYDVGVAGIHRLFGSMKKISKAKVIIVAAGMEGALASVVAGLVDAPVIALPTSVGYGASFKGLAALLAMLNCCAPGVAVVNIDNGFGAACMANAIMRTVNKK